VVLALACLGASAAAAQVFDTHEISRVRAYHAIHEIEDLIAYLEANPYQYGGQKAATIAAARKTILHLRATMGAQPYWVPIECCYKRRPIYVR
jgi:hypothetical protein